MAVVVVVRESPSAVADVVSGSMEMFKAEARERLRWRRPHSSSHFKGLGD